MTRILVQRGSAGSSSSSNQNRSSTSLPSSSSSPSTSAPTQPPVTSTPHSAGKDDGSEGELQEHIALNEISLDALDTKVVTSDNPEGLGMELSVDDGELVDSVAFKDTVESAQELMELGRLTLAEQEKNVLGGSPLRMLPGSSTPPPPPVPPPKPSSTNASPRRFASGTSNASRMGTPRGSSGRPALASRSSPMSSRPSSPRSQGDTEGYNSADEQNPCFGLSCDDVERESRFEIDIRRAKGLEVKKMLADGNCLFRAVADQVYGDSEAHDLVRQMCIDYMERERDHFSQFITEGFTSYCRRKRRDKVYGNNVEIQALSEMYNRPIHIYSYGTEPINIFHGSYNTDTPPIRISYHHGNHYNSLVDPRRVTIGAGLGFGGLRGTNIDKDQVKAAIKAQQDQQIDNALLAEGRFYSDLELTEKEIERMVMEASRAEYLAKDMFKQQIGHRESSSSGAEPSSSGARKEIKQEGWSESVLSESLQIMLLMGFSYPQVIEAYSIFGDDVDSMVSYLIETGSSSRRKGKATE